MPAQKKLIIKWGVRLFKCDHSPKERPILITMENNEKTIQYRLCISIFKIICMLWFGKISSLSVLQNHFYKVVKVLFKPITQARLRIISLVILFLIMFFEI